ncbi:MAG: AAA family ATPase [Candidatus Heimdallarchaeaceae archaeon]
MVIEVSLEDALNKARQLIVGREEELELMFRAIARSIPIVLEGPVGTGKTEMAKTLAQCLSRPFIRVDGDDNLTAVKLKGWYDPPLVLEKGFSRETFIPGPLTAALEQGGIFFFNETNRAPSETINAVLSALDEKLITIPQLGTIKAAEGFLPIFAFNPEDTIATNPLPRAFNDRCIWIHVDHQSLEEMKQIVALRTKSSDNLLIQLSCEIVQETLHHPELESGSSVRGAIQFVQLFREGEELTEEKLIRHAIAVHAKKIRCSSTSRKQEAEIIKEIVSKILMKYEDNKRITRKKA